jgi:hypothetical protein
VDGTVGVSGTVPISAAALPLPAGASTSALQLPDNHQVAVSNFPATQPISAAALPLPAGASTSALQLPDGHNVTVDNAAGAAAVNVQDGGNSLTVDATSLPLPTGASTAALQTQPGVDIGDVTVNNAAGASAVNIQDGGNSITVDGSISITGTPTVDTELPAAAALADAAANPTAPAVGAFNMVWNGATWDRLMGNAAGGAEVQGSVANGVADVGNPVGGGAQARTTNPTAVTDGQRVTLKADKLGRQVVAVGQVRDLISQNNITLTTTTETTLLASVASTFLDLTGVIISNTSGTAVRVDFRDATAGTVRFSIMVAANGGGGIFVPIRPVKQTAVTNNWTAQLSAAVTDVRIFAQAEQNL